jgi:hypothetical protein
MKRRLESHQVKPHIRQIWSAGMCAFVCLVLANLGACSPLRSGTETYSKPQVEPPGGSADEAATALGDRPGSVASMPRAKFESAIGLPTDLIGNGHLRRAFLDREAGVRVGLSPVHVGAFSDVACVVGKTLDAPRNYGNADGFTPMNLESGKSASEILGFDVETKLRRPSIETDLAEFLQGDENTELIFYNPASYLRGIRYLSKPSRIQFDADRCGTSFVNKIALVGQLYVVLKVTYRSPEARAKFEERLHAADIELAKMLTEIKRDPGSFRSLAKFSMAAYQIGGDLTKLAANLGGASHVDCTPDDLSACEGVYKNIINYSTDRRMGFPSQLEPRSQPGPLPLPVGFGDLGRIPQLPHKETLM